mmetsp:Transcript_5552/g.14313  ORF Transcript_5552/g.14313 Transcript_5552/m.14313 type:complete len:273 (+) Transcript_5552:262-1080(+)
MRLSPRPAPHPYLAQLAPRSSSGRAAAATFCCSANLCAAAKARSSSASSSMSVADGPEMASAPAAPSPPAAAPPPGGPGRGSPSPAAAAGSIDPPAPCRKMFSSPTPSSWSTAPGSARSAAPPSVPAQAASKSPGTSNSALMGSWRESPEPRFWVCLTLAAQRLLNTLSAPPRAAPLAHLCRAPPSPETVSDPWPALKSPTSTTTSPSSALSATTRRRLKAVTVPPHAPPESRGRGPWWFMKKTRSPEDRCRNLAQRAIRVAAPSPPRSSAT